MQAIFWTMEEVASRAKQFYENGIRQEVEHGENIGQMIVIDAETGEYGIDPSGVNTVSARRRLCQRLSKYFSDISTALGGLCITSRDYPSLRDATRWRSLRFALTGTLLRRQTLQRTRTAAG
jgi:hypothetical protein